MIVDMDYCTAETYPHATSYDAAYTNGVVDESVIQEEINEETKVRMFDNLRHLFSH